MYVRLGRTTMGIVLVLIGAWFIVKLVLHPGPWFAGATWVLLTLLASAYAAYTRAPGWVLVAFLSAGTAAYAFADAYLGLPGSFYFVFLALGCFGLYQFVTRPFRWPLYLAAVLLGMATVFFIMGIAIRFALYLLPLLLLIWGVSLLLQSGPRRGGRNLQ